MKTPKMVPNGIAKLTKELFTICDLLRWTMSELSAHEVYFGHGTDNAWDEAVNIVLRCLHLPFAIDERILNARLTSSERKKIIDLVRVRIQARIPTAYLLKEAWFADLPYYVDERVMIPRSAIAELIKQEFQPWLGEKNVEHILDLGTGSGCIAVACAKAFPTAKITAVDLDQDALEVAKINIIKHQVADQIELLGSNLFSSLAKSQKFDLIISNPPYVSKKEWENLPAEYYHEPRNAFLGLGNDGLGIVEQILQQAPNYLRKNGCLVVEVGNNLENLLTKYPTTPFICPDLSCGDNGIFVLKG